MLPLGQKVYARINLSVTKLLVLLNQTAKDPAFFILTAVTQGILANLHNGCDSERLALVACS